LLIITQLYYNSTPSIFNPIHSSYYLITIILPIIAYLLTSLLPQIDASLPLLISISILITILNSLTHALSLKPPKSTITPRLAYFI